MGHDIDLFIDAHCHMFTIADLPLFETVNHAAGSLHPITGMLMGALASTVAPKVLKARKPLISFFEAEPEENPRRIQVEIEEALKEQKIVAGEIVTTPLVMDFDLNGKTRKLHQQVERLAAAAQECEGMVVLPFLGLDPRRFVYRGKRVRGRDDVKERLTRFLKDFGVKARGARRDRSQLENGDVLGVKLYPPLGFHPLPDEDPARARHLDLYQALCDRDLPLTVHCQKTSFSFVKKSDVMKFTHPKNWITVLEELEQRGRYLRLNFGHFGGDAGVVSLLWSREDWRSAQRPRPRDLREGSWTKKIARALCTHRHAYADISAIDFTEPHNAAGFLWLLAFDHAGELPWDGEFKLVDKLLWGSDYPMALSGAPKYRDVLGNFLTAYREPRPAGARKVPDPDELPDPKELVRKLCCDNPRAFLFG